MTAGNPVTGTIVKGGQNPRPAKGAARAAPATGESAGESDAPPPSSDGAINTTRSNIKNSF